MLRRVRRSHAVLALALATLAGACGSDSSTAPNVQPVTLDQALAELSTPAVSSIAASFDAGAPTLPALAASSCTYQAATQSFACTPIVANGVTVNQSFTLLDGSGAKQSAFDQATTSAVRANTSVAGTIQDGVDQLTIDGQQELTLSGLRTGTHTLDGTSTMHVVTAGSLDSDETVAVTITGLKLPRPTTDGTRSWPSAGTIAAQITTTLSDFPAETFQATATFNGTSKVKVTISIPGGGVATSCTIDLAADRPSCSASA